MIIRNELHRYLEPCLDHLLEFCDEIRIVDDSSTDGWEDALASTRSRSTVRHAGAVDRNAKPAFHLHADARNQLLRFALESDATHILAIDADEFITDGQLLRQACEQNADAFSVEIAEAWELDGECICTREDGGWRSHPINCVWRTDRFRGQALALADRGHATGRVPDVVHRSRAVPAGVSLLHFGWVNEAEREERYRRYAEGDGGRFHASSHIQSILHRAPMLQGRPWPPSLEPYRAAIERQAGVVAT